MIILASASPRRRELLGLITGDFAVVVSDVDEASDITDPAELVRHLAERKASDVFAQRQDDIVIGADTVVYIDGKILGKPADDAQARAMIGLLQGNTHVVHTGVCVLSAGAKSVKSCATEVTFAPMKQEEIDRYIAAGDVLDKAGAYAIQGNAAPFIERINGCFFNVVGLPLNMLYGMLQEHTTLV